MYPTVSFGGNIIIIPENTVNCRALISRWPKNGGMKTLPEPSLAPPLTVGYI